jgi:hypothetical protein
MDKNKDLFEGFNIFEGIEDIEDIIKSSNAGEEIIEETEEQEEVVVEDDNQVEEQSGEDANSDDTGEIQTTSPLIPYAKFLYEEGVLPSLNIDEFDGTAESLKLAMATEIVSGVNAYKESLPADVKFLVDNYEAGVPLDEIIGIQSAMVRYESIPEADIPSNEDLQKALVTDWLTETTSLSKERIEKHIKRLSDLGELEEEAVSARSELVKIQGEKITAQRLKAEQDAKNNEAKRIKDLSELKTTIDSTKEVIPGQLLTPLMREKLYKNLTTPVATDQYGNGINKLGYYRSQNPMKTELILNYIFEATKEFSDWSILGKGVKSAVIKELEDAAKTIDSNNSGKPASKSKTGQSSKELLDAINNINF